MYLWKRPKNGYVDYLLNCPEKKKKIAIMFRRLIIPLTVRYMSWYLFSTLLYIYKQVNIIYPFGPSMDYVNMCVQYIRNIKLQDHLSHWLVKL